MSDLDEIFFESFLGRFGPEVDLAIFLSDLPFDLTEVKSLITGSNTKIVQSPGNFRLARTRVRLIYESMQGYRVFESLALIYDVLQHVLLIKK